MKNNTQMKIIVRNNDVSKALRILKKKLNNEGVFKEVRDRQSFTPPGEKRRLSEKAGRKRWIKKRALLEQKFIRDEANQFRKNRNKNRNNVQRTNKNTNQSRNWSRSSGNQNNRPPRS
jgi:small subunit ribosomal protein S21